MFNKLSRAIAHHPWRAIITWLVVAVLTSLAALWGFGQGNVFDRLHNSASLVPGTESDVVDQLTSQDADGVTLTVVVGGLDLARDFADVASFMADHRSQLSDLDQVSAVFDPFQLPDPTLPAAQALFSDKQDGFIITVSLDPDLSHAEAVEAETRVSTAIGQLEEDLRATYPDAIAQIVSSKALSDAVMGQIKTDLLRGETIGLPVALLLLIIVFGGFLAAGLPVIGAVVAIGSGMGVLWSMTFVTDVEAFTINIATIIGLALSVDYGLLIVSRYREELAATLVEHGYPSDGSKVPDKTAARPIVAQAMEVTLRTAGRTVFFSAVTIACAVSALLVLKASMMQIIAEASIAVTLLAVLTAVTLVPAVIVVMRRAIIKPSLVSRAPGLRKLVKAVGDTASDAGVFSKLARGVHRRPWLIMILIAVVLVAMASPLRQLEMRTAFSDYFPDQAEVTEAFTKLQDDYPGLREASILIVADVPPERTAALTAYLSEQTAVDYVSVASPLPSDAQRSLIGVHLDVENQVGGEVTDLVKQLRAYDAGFTIHVGGAAGLQHDFIQAIMERAPLALVIMVLAVFILMFLLTGSLIVPLKAVIINSLSLLASLGATTFIFMNGYLGMPKVLGMETFIVVCAICFGFGLAMDYEVFLIARIKEYFDAGLPNDQAVERGLQRSGRIITSAAAIIVAVFIGFTFGQMIPIKEIGVVLAITVITDATLVRMLLVPATMTILGKWNWWSPKPLHRLYEKMGIVH